VETSGGIQASLSGRYATALFSLAHDQNQIDIVGKSLDSLRTALADSADLRALTTNPLISRGDAGKAIQAIGAAMTLDPLTINFLGVLAHNRRLAQLGQVIASFAALAASHRGETTATVTSAHPLDAGQVDAIKAQLKTKVGRDVAVTLTTDPALLGGLIVKIGSQMIDSSIRTRLNTLAIAMKG
jgi:F-type H+-transporting ATPase subunit delta